MKEYIKPEITVVSLGTNESITAEIQTISAGDQIATYFNNKNVVHNVYNF